MALQLIPKRRTLSNPSLIHLFSTSSSSSSVTADSDDQNDHSKSSTSNPPLSSYFSNAKASPRRQQKSSPPPLSPRTFPYPPPSFTPPFTAASLEELRKNLVHLRLPNLTPPANSGPTPSFRDLHKWNVLNNEDDRSSGWGTSMDSIRRRLSQMQASNDAPQTSRRGSDPMSDYSSAPSRSAVFGVTDPVPQSVFGKEIRERKEGDEPSVRKPESVKMIDELNQKRLRELEEKETESRSAGLSYKDMRKSLLLKESLVELKLSFDDEKKKTNRRVRVNRSVR